MAIKLFVLVCWGWISGWNLVCSAASDQINIPAKPGDNVTLSCQANSSTNIIVVEWSRPDLEPEYVFMYRDGQPHPDNQHEYFKDRVELEDSEMKDRNVSLVLRNVTINDSGTYKCCVVQGKTTRRKRSYLNTEPISTIYLDVKLDLQVELGQNVDLPCKTPSSHIRAVEWTKTDLEEPEYVLFYRDGHLDGAHQHPSFNGRVDLLDRQMKNGDLTLSLRNVTSTDNGTYECQVSAGGSGRRKRAIIKGDLIRRVKLELKQHPGSTGGQTGEGGAKEGGDKDGGAKEGGDKGGGAKDGGDEDRNSGGHVGLIVGLSLLVVVVVVGSVLLKYKRHMKKNPHPPPPPDEEAGDQQLL